MNAGLTNISSTETLTSAMGPVRILMAAGGTGGHVYPAIAIADAIKEKHPDAEILFAGTRDRMEWTAVPKSGYEISSVWISGFHRRLTPQNLLFPVKLLVSIMQSYKIIKKFKPDAVVACGGFASGPIGWTAAKTGVPLVLQEQNSFPGVTNRMLAKYASRIFTAFDDASEYLPKEKIMIAGNPVRANLAGMDKQEALKQFGFDEHHPTLFVMGGSGGAKSVNDAMLQNLAYLHDELGLQIIWQCGVRYLNELKDTINTESLPNLRLLDYIDNMAAAYAVSDLVISRAGAGACSELMLTGKPAVLVPSPHVAGDHQAKNAEAMVADGAAVLLKDEDVQTSLHQVVDALIFDKKELNKMAEKALALAKPNAAAIIADEVLQIVSQSSKKLN
jgi:UDP-N-acetylglucosamine--N-acetylmuramyl-(pentapeptide) pyrophosphoryl-undecaprenol N-acetylglucosamine transferase